MLGCKTGENTGLGGGSHRAIASDTDDWRKRNVTDEYKCHPMTGSCSGHPPG